MNPELKNECQQMVLETFAAHSALNTPNTLTAAGILGEALAHKILEREQGYICERCQSKSGENFISIAYLTDRLKDIIPHYTPTKYGAFEDLWSVLRQDSFLLRSVALVAQVQDNKVLQIQGVLKALTTWITSWAQYDPNKS